MNYRGYLKIVLFVVFIMFFTVTVLISSPQIYATISSTPPMGWNSYDCFNYTVTETEVKANADYMATNLKPYGWEYICVDWAWYYSGTGTGSPNQDSNFNPKLNIDSYGRVMPDTSRFPSSVNGQGFKPLADYIHDKGLKFGIHLMRGIPRQAVTANTPILGTSYRANDIADKTNLCAWLNLMYGLNMNHSAAQAYLNSLFELYASWGVDFVKVDDLINPYGSPAYRQSEIEGYRTAINNCGREMVFSTSPGATPLANASQIMQIANQWRMANDLWDNWNNLNAMFDLAASWYPYAGAGHWPDADMIPIGKLSKRGPNGTERYSNLTSDEKFTMMTLWCIARSPLIWGGNLVENRTEELQLMQNSEVIAVNQNSANNRPVVNGNTPIWCADVPATNDKYVAIFNRNSSATNVTINFSSIGISGSAMLRDLWAKNNLGTFSGSYTVNLSTHQCKLYRITPTSSPTTNLITNSDLETGNNSGWSVNGAGSIAVATAQKHSGAYSLYHTGRTATWNGPLQNITSKVQNGNTYTCSGWVRLDNATNGSVVMTIKKTDGSGTTYTNIATATGSNSSWVQLSGSYTLSVSGTLTELSIYFEGPNSGINMYVDDVSVASGTAPTPTPTPTPGNLLTNAGLETGNTTGWAVNGAGSIAVSSTQKHSGTYSLLSTGRTATWNGPLQNITSKVQSGETYACSGWVRLDNAASGTVIMTIKKTDGSGTSYTNIASATGSNSSWVQLSGNYSLSVSGTLTELSIYFEGPASGVNYYMDDLSVQ